MEAKIAPGRPQDDEKWSKNFSGPPPARTSEFFFAPGGLQERSGVDFYSVLAAPLGPGGSGGSFLVIWELILAQFLVIWGAVLGSVVGPPGGDKTAAKAAEAAAKVTEAVERNSSDSSRSSRKQQRKQQKHQ